MDSLSRRSAIRAFAAGSIAIGSLAATRTTFADDSNDDHDDSSSTAHFAAFIYAGTLSALDQATVVTDIDDLELETHERENDDDHEGNRDRDRQRDQSWQLLGDGQVAPDELYTGDEDLDDSIDLDTLTAEPHLVVVHETGSQDSPIIVVGVIEGEATPDGTLLIQLAEHEGSGYEGRAWFGPKTDDDDENDDNHELEVVVGVYPAGAVQPLGTPSARG